MAFVFIRNPKTAGSSVTSVLVDKLGGWRVPPSEQCRIDDFRQGLENHSIAVCDVDSGRRLWQGLTADERREHVAVGFMRNPYDRFISGWAYCRDKGIIDHDADPRLLLSDPTQISWLARLHCHRLQIKSLFGDDDIKIPSIILTYEQLDEDFNRLLKRLGVARTHQIPRKNTSRRKLWRAYYDDYPGLQELVEDHFYWDFATLPYIFAQDHPTGPLPQKVGANAQDA